MEVAAAVLYQVREHVLDPSIARYVGLVDVEHRARPRLGPGGRPQRLELSRRRRRGPDLADVAGSDARIGDADLDVTDDLVGDLVLGQLVEGRRDAAVLVVAGAHRDV